jgi:hypothetical protein
MNNYPNNYNNLSNPTKSNQYLTGEYENLLNNVTNDNLINLANSIDPLSLNGTNLDDNVNYNYMTGKPEDNSSLIKSLTKEIIGNLKENKTSVYDNTSINSNPNLIQKNKETFDSKGETESDIELEQDTKSSSKSSKSSKRKKSPSSESNLYNFNYYKWFIDDCFNYKDFLVLFILYFVLSQEMIKDFFAKYFTSLNSDDDGKIGVQGVIIYGLILTVLFMILRKLF